MRSFFVASVLFIILLIVIFTNALFVISHSARLLEQASDIPDIHADGCADKVNEFAAEWEKFKKAASFSISYSELNKISCLIDDLRIHLSNNNEADFDHTLSALVSNLRELPRFENLTANAIF